jgi:hypothetical protein
MLPNTSVMPMSIQDISVSTMKLLKTLLEYTNSKILQFLDFKFWRKLSFCTLLTKKTIMTSWRQKLINIQDNINLTLRASLIQTKRFSEELEWKNWMTQLKTITLVILSVDSPIAETMILEDGSPPKRQDCSIIDLLPSSQSMFFRF